jgi:hypothetical protein
MAKPTNFCLALHEFGALRALTEIPGCHLFRFRGLCLHWHSKRADQTYDGRKEQGKKEQLPEAASAGASNRSDYYAKH